MGRKTGAYVGAISTECTGEERGKDVMWGRFREKRILGKEGGLAMTAGCDWYKHNLACLLLSGDMRAVLKKGVCRENQTEAQHISASVNCLIWTDTWLYAYLHVCICLPLCDFNCCDMHLCVLYWGSCACVSLWDSRLSLLAGEQEGTWQVCQACWGVFLDSWGGKQAYRGMGWEYREAMCCSCHMSRLAR